MTYHVVRCRAPRRTAEFDGQLCGRFVARVPWPFIVTGILRHSSDARDGAVVAACPACGALHEIRRDLAHDPAKGVA